MREYARGCADRDARVTEVLKVPPLQVTAAYAIVTILLDPVLMTWKFDAQDLELRRVLEFLNPVE